MKWWSRRAKRKETLRRLQNRKEPNRTYSWTRPWMFRIARKLVPGFHVGFLHVSPGDHLLIQLLYGPRLYHFTKDHGKPGQIWNPRRWGGGFCGIEIGCRG